MSWFKNNQAPVLRRNTDKDGGDLSAEHESPLRFWQTPQTRA